MSISEGCLRGLDWRGVSGVWIGGVSQGSGLEGCLRGLDWRGVSGVWIGGVSQGSGLEGCLRGLDWRGVSGVWIGGVSAIQGSGLEGSAVVCAMSWLTGWGS